MTRENDTTEPSIPEGASKKESDFYHKLRARVRKWTKEKSGSSKWADYVMLAPDFFHLLCKLSVDKEVPRGEKVKLALAVAYFISPIDLLPEAFLGPVGYLDDVALAAYVLNSIVNETDPEVVRRNWAGDGDVLDWIQRVLDASDDMLGTGMWKRLKKVVGGGRPRGPRSTPKPGI